jgi:putative endonuclease
VSNLSFSSKELGKTGEDIAVEFLINKGYEIIQRNYRFSKTGEIDIIAKDDNCLVFVEVKTKGNLEFGLPDQAVSKGKLKQVKRIAEYYLYDKNLKDTNCRIDVIAILIEKGEVKTLNHYENVVLL